MAFQQYKVYCQVALLQLRNILPNWHVLIDRAKFIWLFKVPDSIEI